jgi:predicted ATPase
MQERCDLVQDQTGRCIEGNALRWDELPARVERVIEERIDRLETELREILTMASVEGEVFTAEVVARVQAIDVRKLCQQLSQELDRQHHLVGPYGVHHVGRQRFSLYRFQHHLFQKYLYNNLAEAERLYLHEDMGNILEELYGDHVEKIAIQLARHFEEAGQMEKAVH